MKNLLAVLAAVLMLAANVDGQEAPHGRGYVPSPFSKELRAASEAKHGKRLRALQQLDLPEKFETPFQIPQQDQGSCGSCWDVSACVSISGAFVAAGMAKGDGSFVMSADTVMWCYNTGGCSGDDASTVMRIAAKDGLPINADVGEYKATGRGPCNKAATRYKISDWGYADANDDGVADYQEIKAVILAHGCCVITVSANGLIDGEQVSTSRGGRTDHQISVVGWDDTKKGSGYSGALLCKNQWGNWGFKHQPPKGTQPEYGYCWLANLSSGRIAASGSEEVLWCRADNPNPPAPPTPPVPVFPGISGSLFATQSNGTIAIRGTLTLEQGAGFRYIVEPVGDGTYRVVPKSSL
jgi:C1A family cysteine protease